MVCVCLPYKTYTFNLGKRTTHDLYTYMLSRIQTEYANLNSYNMRCFMVAMLALATTNVCV